MVIAAFSRLAATHSLRLNRAMRYPRSALFVALLSLLVAFASSLRAHAPATDMQNAAKALLSALTPDQNKKASYPLTDKERENWNFVPLARSGLPLKEMTPAQQD